MGAVGPHAGHVLAASAAVRQLLVVGVCVGILLVLLTVPVLWDSLMDVASKQAKRFAPRTFIAGGCILLAGLVVHITIVSLIGGGIMAVVVVAAILDNY
jgi:hypothetical protein